MIWNVLLPFLITIAVVPLVFFLHWEGPSDRLGAGTTLLLAALTFKASLLERLLPG